MKFLKLANKIIFILWTITGFILFFHMLYEVGLHLFSNGLRYIINNIGIILFQILLSISIVFFSFKWKKGSHWGIISIAAVIFLYCLVFVGSEYCSVFFCKLICWYLIVLSFFTFITGALFQFFGESRR